VNKPQGCSKLNIRQCNSLDQAVHNAPRLIFAEQLGRCADFRSAERQPSRGSAKHFVAYATLLFSIDKLEEVK
jgi:hypothetical protein